MILIVWLVNNKNRFFLYFCRVKKSDATSLSVVRLLTFFRFYDFESVDMAVGQKDV